jgi:hypothetical protein
MMLNSVYASLIQALTLVEDVKKLKSEDKELRQELNEIVRLVTEWRQEQIHDREIALRDRENLLLRLENAMLRSERRLSIEEAKDEPKDDLRERVAVLERANEELRRRIEELESR